MSDYAAVREDLAQERQQNIDRAMSRLRTCPDCGTDIGAYIMRPYQIEWMSEQGLLDGLTLYQQPDWPEVVMEPCRTCKAFRQNGYVALDQVALMAWLVEHIDDED